MAGLQLVTEALAQSLGHVNIDSLGRPKTAVKGKESRFLEGYSSSCEILDCCRQHSFSAEVICLTPNEESLPAL